MELFTLLCWCDHLLPLPHRCMLRKITSPVNLYKIVKRTFLMKNYGRLPYTYSVLKSISKRAYHKSPPLKCQNICHRCPVYVELKDSETYRVAS